MTPSGSSFSYVLGNSLCQCWIIWWEFLTSVSPDEITIASFEREIPQRLGLINESLPSRPRFNYRLFCPSVSLVNKMRFGELGWVHEFNSLSRNQRGTCEKKCIALEYYCIDTFPVQADFIFLCFPLLRFPLLRFRDVMLFTNWRQDPPLTKRLLLDSLYCDTCFNSEVYNWTHRISEVWLY